MQIEQPWLTEPDFAKWRDPKTGLKCAIMRNQKIFVLCGYVAIPPGSLRKRLTCNRHRYYQVLKNINVHGGVTFSGHHNHHRLQRGFWIGFDCAHAFDLVPGMFEIFKRSRDIFPVDVYRDFAYVKAEVTSLAQQIAMMI